MGMPAVYRLLADVLVVAHAGYVGFVVIGELAILAGLARHWQWVGNVKFRLAHLAAIVVVVLEAAWGITCPLTVWENRLREKAGDSAYAGDFIAGWVHRALFYDAAPWVFTTCYSLFGALVVLTFIFAPPRRKQLAHSKAPCAPA